MTSGEPTGAAVTRTHIGGDLVVTVTRGAAWCVVTTLSGVSHSGDMTMDADLASAVRGCNRSGDRARRNRGEPGSEVLHGRPNDGPAVFLPQQPAADAAAAAAATAAAATGTGVADDDSADDGVDGVDADDGVADDGGPPFGADSSEDGLYDCVVLELPGWWPAENVSGLGDRVGDCGSGDGDGVRASGDSGMWPTDLRLLGECRFLVAECSLCLSPCNVDGRWYGELGVTVGDELADELDELVDDE